MGEIYKSALPRLKNGDGRVAQLLVYLNSAIAELIAITGAGGGGGGDASAANQTTQIALETQIRDAVLSIDTSTIAAVWESIVGNSKVINYGTVNGAKEVTTIEYKTGVSTIFTQTFVYDIDNDVTSITAS